MSQKTELFITTAARTSNPTWYVYLEKVADHVLEVTMDSYYLPDSACFPSSLSSYIPTGILY
jgi:hypothetical protein